MQAVTKSDYFLERLPQSRWDIWDSFVDKCPDGTIFQKSGYIQKVQEAFDRPVEILAVFHGADLAGGTVLYPLRKGGIRYTTTPFYIPCNGLLVDSFDRISGYRQIVQRQSRVIDLLQKEITETNSYAQFHLFQSVKDLRVFIWNDWHILPSYHIKINLKQKNLYHDLRRNHRRNIDKFKYLPVELNTTDDMELLYQLMAQSYQRHQIKPPLQKQKFVRFTQKLIKSELAKCYLLNSNDTVLAALLVVEDFPVVYAMFAGRKVNSNFAESELYLHWLLMEKYQKKNFMVFNLLGAMVPSIAHVKIGLGGELYRFDEIRYFRNGIIKFIFYIDNRFMRIRRSL